MIDRLGPRRMAITGIVFTTIGLVVFSQARTLEIYYLSSLILAFGQSLGSLQPFSAALMFWFQRKRGQAMGLLNTGNGAGHLMAPVVALLVIWVGWRSTLLLAAVVVFLLGIPLAMVLRDRPEPYGYTIDGDAPEPGAGEPSVAPDATGMSVGEGLRTPTFYLLSVSSALAGGPDRLVDRPPDPAPGERRLLDRGGPRRSSASTAYASWGSAPLSGGWATASDASVSTRSRSCARASG